MEIWKDVKGYEGIYKISNFGNVKSLERLKKSKGNSTRVVNERILKYNTNIFGYKYVILCKESKNKCFLIHRLIGIAFIPNPENKPQINHINGIKTDNSISNLEWCTQQENSIHAFKTGLMHHNPKVGERHGRSKLTEKEVLEIRNDNRTHEKIAQSYNVSSPLISHIKQRKLWRHI